MTRSTPPGGWLTRGLFLQNAVAKVGNASVRSRDAALGEQFAYGAIGDAAFAKRDDVVFESQQTRSTRPGRMRVLRRGRAEAV